MEEKFDLPIASIARIIRNALPKHYQVGKDARLAMAKATSVWILYCATVANTISTSRKRKTISGDDVLAALVEMDFEDFVGPLKEMRSELTISARKKAKLSRLANAAGGEDPLEGVEVKPDMDDETEDGPVGFHQDLKHGDDEDVERDDVESHEDDAFEEDDIQDESEVDDDEQENPRPVVDSSLTAETNLIN